MKNLLTLESYAGRFMIQTGALKGIVKPRHLEHVINRFNQMETHFFEQSAPADYFIAAMIIGNYEVAIMEAGKDDIIYLHVFLLFCKYLWEQDYEKSLDGYYNDMQNQGADRKVIPGTVADPDDLPF